MIFHATQILATRKEPEGGDSVSFPCEAGHGSVARDALEFPPVRHTAARAAMKWPRAQPLSPYDQGVMASAPPAASVGAWRSASGPQEASSPPAGGADSTRGTAGSREETDGVSEVPCSVTVPPLPSVP